MAFSIGFPPWCAGCCPSVMRGKYARRVGRALADGGRRHHRGPPDCHTAARESGRRLWNLDVEGTERERTSVEEVGTRHRAAHLFVDRHRQGLAIVISQDGGVNFVAHREEGVIFWGRSVSP